MSADDQVFFDTLSSVPNDIRRYSNEVADYVDKQLDHVSTILREALSSSPWLPESARPRPPPSPPNIQSVTSSSSTYARVHDWVMKNKILTTVIVIAIGGVTYHIIKKKSTRKKRRAKKAGNGARFEVVVIAGSPSDPITRSISLDLERRGFIVYVVCNTIEEEVLVQNESRPDIKPLMIDIVDPNSARASIDRFTHHLRSPHYAFEGARPHHLSLRSLLIIPSQTYPSQPIATLAPSTISDLLNTRLLSPILTLQTFLPLLTNSTLKPSVLIVTPTIISALRPAFHLPECSLTSALSSFADVLTAELAPLEIPVVQMQLGSFDLRAYEPHNKQITAQSQRAETLRWDDSNRLAFGKNFVSTTTAQFGRGIGRGSTLRELNDAVFDALVRGKSGVVRVGMGSSLYGFVGRWVPRGLIGFMLGMRKVVKDESEFGKGKELVRSGQGSRGTSPGSSSKGSGSLRYSAADLGMEESEFISVYGEKGQEVDHECDERCNHGPAAGFGWDGRRLD